MRLAVGVFTGLFILAVAIALLTNIYYFAIIPFVLLVLYAGWQNLSIVFLLLLFSLPFSTEYHVTDTLGTDFPDELLMLFTAALAGCYVLYQPSLLPRKLVSHPLFVLVMLGFVWSAVSALSSTQPLLSVKFLLAKTWYIGAFVLAPLLLFSNKKMIWKSIASITTAMLLIMLTVMIRHAEYGFSFASVNKALQPFFRNHVNYSAMLVCMAPVIAIYAIWVKSRSLKWMSIIVLAILLGALFISYARGAWLALFTGLSAGWLIHKKWMVWAYILFIGLVMGSVFWIKSQDRYLQFAHDYKTTIWHSNFSEHLVATYALKDVSTAERFYRWIAGIRMIKDRWLTGYGPNSFYYNYKSYTIPAFRTWVSNNDEHSTVHNYFLLVAIEQGLPGLIFFLLLTAALLYYAQVLYHRLTDKFYKQLALGTGIILVMVLTVNFLSDLIETDKVGSLFFLCISMLVRVDWLNKEYLNQDSGN